MTHQSNFNVSNPNSQIEYLYTCPDCHGPTRDPGRCDYCQIDPDEPLPIRLTERALCGDSDYGGGGNYDESDVDYFAAMWADKG